MRVNKSINWNRTCQAIACAEVQENGGKVVFKRNLLCEDENSQSSKARYLGVKVISEEGLLQIL